MPLGYTFGGKHIHEFKTEMTGKEVPITPPFTNNAESQGGRDGGWDYGIQYDPKIIPVDHYIWTQTRVNTQELIRELAGHFNPRLGARELIFDDEPDKMYYGRLNDQIKLDQIIKLYNDFTLEFICYDPFTYSVQEFTQDTTTNPNILHKGTHVSKPILVIDKVAGPGTVTCTPPNGKGDPMVVEFNKDAPSGQYTIDMKEGTVKRGSEGGDKHMDKIEWIEMPPGTSTFTKSSNITKVVVKYRHTWL